MFHVQKTLQRSIISGSVYTGMGWSLTFIQLMNGVMYKISQKHQDLGSLQKYIQRFKKHIEYLQSMKWNPALQIL